MISNPGSIFLSYRRSDSISDSGRIYDYLERHFGRERVFKDVDSIPVGVNFRDFLDREVSQCRVFIAVIGPSWLMATDQSGNLRLNNPGDFVRLEIESALKKRIPIIPLLVNGAGMPDVSKLPSSLKALVDWQSLSVRQDPDFRKDMSKLISGIERLLDLSAEKLLEIDDKDNEIVVTPNLDIPEFLLRRRNR